VLPVFLLQTMGRNGCISLRT